MLGFGRSGIFAYSRGKHHINLRPFQVSAGKKKYSVKIEGLFLPQQVHEDYHYRLGKITNSAEIQKHVIPYGGDLFSYAQKRSQLNFFVMDVAGHGLQTYGITRELAKIVKKHIYSDDIIQRIESYWRKQRSKSEKRQKKAGKKSVKKQTKLFDNALKAFEQKVKGIEHITDAELIKNFRNHMQSFEQSGFLAATQAIVDLKDLMIKFYSYGNPDQYLIYMDHQTVHVETHPTKRNRVFGFSPITMRLGRLQKIEEDHGVHLPKDSKRFRLVLLSDAILDQAIYPGAVNEYTQLIKEFELDTYSLDASKPIDTSKLLPKQREIYELVQEKGLGAAHREILKKLKEESQRVESVIKKTEKETEKRSLKAQKERMMHLFGDHGQLLYHTLDHFYTRPPGELIQFLYRYLRGHNVAPQGDDLTIAVVDVELVA